VVHCEVCSSLGNSINVQITLIYDSLREKSAEPPPTSLQRISHAAPPTKPTQDPWTERANEAHLWV